MKPGPPGDVRGSRRGGAEAPSERSASQSNVVALGEAAGGRWVAPDAKPTMADPPSPAHNPCANPPDAALKLLSSLAPAWDVAAHGYAPYDTFWVAIWPKDLQPAHCYEGRAATLELAVLAAVLKALGAMHPALDPGD